MFNCCMAKLLWTPKRQGAFQQLNNETIKQLAISLHTKKGFINFQSNKPSMPYMRSLFVAAGLILFSACNSDSKKAPEAKKDSVDSQKEKKPHPKAEVSTKKPPIINIVDSVQPKRIIIYLKDSASTYERMSMKLGQIYGVRLAECFKKNSLKVAGAPVAWYSTHKAPYFFEAGIPVNKRPTKLMGGIKVREIRQDSVVIAHFYGPYDLMNVGYDALNEWLKDHKRRLTAPAYEVYVGDPVDKKGKPVDPYKVQTDIIFPRR